MKYQQIGLYDADIFRTKFIKGFRDNPRYDPAAVPTALYLLDLIGRDLSITDVRWAAYMMATVLWETTCPKSIKSVARDKKGRPLLDKKGMPVVLSRKAWLMTMAPVNEVGRGKGRAYHEPVKVKLLGNGSVRVTEQDGDVFSISPKGAITELTTNARMGSPSGGGASAAYEKDDGVEHAYFGRGYVQLTWWSNYAKAGIALGRGLDLLLDPDLVKDPRTAYELMSHGMRTGQGFANGRTFHRFFTSETTDYKGARRMVNGTDHADEIAEIAVTFETILLAARPAKIMFDAATREINAA